MSKPSLAESFRCHDTEKDPSSPRTEPAGKIDGRTRQYDRPLRSGQTGLKFSEVKEDASYCKWFLRKWGDSEKAEHRALIRYLQLWIERQELEHGVPDPDTTSVGNKTDSAAYPKAKAKHITGSGSANALENDLDEEEWWDHLTPTKTSRRTRMPSVWINWKEY